MALPARPRKQSKAASRNDRSAETEGADIIALNKCPGAARPVWPAFSGAAQNAAPCFHL